ncbi:NADP-dependent oxidoreductase domain-containing protein [Mycena galopus ATCC 62051]|nr:NADP-dependent oxidoreductase domain-containing protein [Mycena galopus ATCC 62051]
MEKESLFTLLEAYFDAGGNHIDTANAYQNGETRCALEGGLKQEGYRNTLRHTIQSLMRSLQYTFPFTLGDAYIKQHELFLGNNTKSMKLSLEASLKKLRTTYVDIFYVHVWDLHTSFEEPMDSSHIFVLSAAGKEISDSSVRFVAKANEYAKASDRHG